MRKLPAAPALLAAAALLAAPTAMAEEATEGGATAAGETDAGETAEDAESPAEAEKRARKEKADKAGDDAAALGNPAMAAAQSGDRPFPIFLQTSVTNTVGSGTMVVGYANNALVATNLNVSPFIMWKGWLAFASQNFDLEWTPSDTTTTRNQVMWSDTQLAARYMNLPIPAAKLNFQVGGGASLPVSLASQWAGRLTTLSANGRVLWSLPAGFTANGGVNANYSVFVPGLANRAIDINRIVGGSQPVNCILRTAEEGNNFGCGAVPRAGGYGVNAGLMWFGFDGQLMVSGSMAFMHSVNGFIGPDDQFTPPNAQTGVQFGIPMTSGNLSVSYTPVSWFTLSGGTSTVQPLYQPGAVRPFPFWDVLVENDPNNSYSTPLSSAANNYSTVWLSTTFTL